MLLLWLIVFEDHSHSGKPQWWLIIIIFVIVCWTTIQISLLAAVFLFLNIFLLRYRIASLLFFNIFIWYYIILIWHPIKLRWWDLELVRGFHRLLTIIAILVRNGDILIFVGTGHAKNLIGPATKYWISLVLRNLPWSIWRDYGTLRK